MPAAGGATAWSRIILDRAVKDPGGNYDAIHALNLYDCKSRRFTTQRRAYFNGDTQVREEEVARQRANAVAVGSIDERLFNVACRAVVAGKPALPFESTGKAGTETQTGERPVAMHADMRALAPDSAARPSLMPVADTTPVVPAEKPKLIVLPPIDKAAAAQAAAAVGQRPPAVPATTGGAPGPAGKMAAPSAPASGAVESPADKRRRELHYANSGPPRAVRKKASAEPSAAVESQKPAMRDIPWSYEGDGGPANWGKLRADYATCATGKRQSPIDIREGIRVNLEPIKFEYVRTQFRIVDTGHAVQVNVGAGLGLRVMGKRFELSHLEFRRPAEERVNGRSYDMSVHLVHRSDDGQIAVVAVLLEKGAEHPLIQTLWDNLPLERDVEVAPEAAIDLNVLLPENRAYWTYMGSLTTPPCTEGVLWMVLKQPVQVAADQVAIFSRVFRSNARPVQAANGRLVKESR
ncbi:MAG: carbonic anhydrase family protein [Rhodocyclales bacterium]|nr:carbonic anhydrase family protein [Rhodocyclales bacterium]